MNNHRTYAHSATELLKLFTLYLLVRKQFEVVLFVRGTGEKA